MHFDKCTGGSLEAVVIVSETCILNACAMTYSPHTEFAPRPPELCDLPQVGDDMTSEHPDLRLLISTCKRQA